MTTVMKHEDSSGKGRWRQYIVLGEGRYVFLEMEPALFGWNVRRAEKRNRAEDWGDMTEAQIVDWKIRSHDVALCGSEETTRILELLEKRGL